MTPTSSSIWPPLLASNSSSKAPSRPSRPMSMAPNWFSKPLARKRNSSSLLPPPRSMAKTPTFLSTKTPTSSSAPRQKAAGATRPPKRLMSFSLSPTGKKRSSPSSSFVCSIPSAPVKPAATAWCSPISSSPPWTTRPSRFTAPASNPAASATCATPSKGLSALWT